MKHLKTYEIRMKKKWVGEPKFKVGDDVTFVYAGSPESYPLITYNSYEVENVIWSKKRKHFKIKLKGVDNDNPNSYFEEKMFLKTIDMAIDKYNL